MTEEQHADARQTSTIAQTSQRGELLFVWCDAGRLQLERLLNEVEQRFAEAGSPVTIQLYGVSAKARWGYLIAEATRGVPSDVRQWLQGEPQIIDYTIRVAPALAQQEYLRLVEWAALRYSRKLDPPPVPVGYTLLTEPVCVDQPSGEIWTAYAQSADPLVGRGLVLYDFGKVRELLGADESLFLLAYLLTHGLTLLEDCPLEFLIAPQHRAMLRGIKRAAHLFQQEVLGNTAQQEEDRDDK